MILRVSSFGFVEGFNVVLEFLSSLFFVLLFLSRFTPLDL